MQQNNPFDETPEIFEDSKNRSQIIFVQYPEQTFAPHQYNNFRVGGMSYQTFIKEGETPEDAYKRAWDFLEAMSRLQYIKAHQLYWERFIASKTPPPTLRPGVDRP